MRINKLAFLAFTFAAGAALAQGSTTAPAVTSSSDYRTVGVATGGEGTSSASPQMNRGYRQPAFAVGQQHPIKPAELAAKRKQIPPDLAVLAPRKTVKRQLPQGVVVKDGMVYLEKKPTPEEIRQAEKAQAAVQQREEATSTTIDLAQAQAQSFQNQMLTGTVGMAMLPGSVPAGNNRNND